MKRKTEKKTTVRPKRKNHPAFEAKKGKIQEILKDPAIEAKRLANLRKSLTNFKNGKYVKELPYYCNNCPVKNKCPFYQAPKHKGDLVVCALQKTFRKWFSPKDFDYREEKKVEKTKNRIMNVLLQRAAINLWFEVLEGGKQDKALSQLFLAILDRLEPSPTVENHITINQAMQGLTPEQIRKVRKFLPQNAWEEILNDDGHSETSGK